MTLSNLEYCTVVSFSSMKSLTLFPGGIDQCVIRRQPDVFLGYKHSCMKCGGMHPSAMCNKFKQTNSIKKSYRSSPFNKYSR
jgi:hypothetical protein